MEEYGIPIDHIAGELVEVLEGIELTTIYRHEYRRVHRRTVCS